MRKSFRMTKHVLAFAAISAGLSGCGLSTPRVSLSERYGAGPIAYNEIANKVLCDLEVAVRASNQEHDIRWIEQWGAKVTLKFAADEASSISPGATYKDLLTPATVTFRNGLTQGVGRSFALSAEGRARADAKLEDTYDFFVDFEESIFKKPGQSCVQNNKGSAILGDLGLTGWLQAAGLAASTPGTIYNYFGDRGPYASLSHKVEFVTEFSGGVTPVWNIVDLTANSTSPLLFGSRKRSDYLLITMGPVDEIIKRERRDTVVQSQPSAAVVNSHLAGLIGQEVKAAIQQR